MNVGFSDGFFDSLKRLNRYETWWYKTYEAVRYDMPRFFKNIRRFRRELCDFQDWDYGYNLDLFKRSLELTADYLETKGIEVDVSRIKKVAKIRKAVELLGNVRGDSRIERAEKELGKLILRDWEFEESEDHPGSMVLKDTETEEENAHNRKVFARANEIEEEEWKLLWEIIKGQDHQEYSSKYQKIKESTPEDAMHAYDDWFDGSGMRGWWD
jgi:hypothetical protein